jgi:hypothetical protein
MIGVTPDTRGRGVEGTPSSICRLYRRVHQAKKIEWWLGDPSNQREVQGLTNVSLNEGRP